MVVREKGYSLQRVMKIVESDTRLKEIDVKVYQWLGTYSEKWWISYLKIYGRKGLNITRKEVVESIKRLSDCGYLTMELKGNGNFGEELFLFRLKDIAKDTLYSEVRAEKPAFDISSMILPDEEEENTDINLPF